MQIRATRFPCPRCGQRLTLVSTQGSRRLLLRALMLRRWRCTSKCGWNGFRFSRSLISLGKRRARKVLIALFVVLAATFTIRYVLSRLPSGTSPGGYDGVHETE